MAKEKIVYNKKAVPCENSFFNIGTYVLTL
jgi:hypothetical protein